MSCSCDGNRFDGTSNGASAACEARAMVESMRKLAEEKHSLYSNPRKGTNAPYITHPAAVVSLLQQWGFSADDPDDAIVLAIAWGHDLLEDTYVTEDELANASKPWSNDVVEGIKQLTFTRFTDVRDWSKEEKKKAKSAYINRIGKEAEPRHLVVKIADRLCNTLDFCVAKPTYARDYLALGEALFERIHACKGAERIQETLAFVRKKSEEGIVKSEE